jgi:hypothetical protein
MEIQDRRLTTLTPILKDMLLKVAEVRAPTFDGVIFYRLSMMKNELHEYAVTYVQSLWRRHLSRRQFKKDLKGTVLCKQLCFYHVRLML